MSKSSQTELHPSGPPLPIGKSSLRNLEKRVRRLKKLLSPSSAVTVTPNELVEYIKQIKDSDKDIRSLLSILLDYELPGLLKDVGNAMPGGNRGEVNYDPCYPDIHSFSGSGNFDSPKDDSEINLLFDLVEIRHPLERLHGLLSNLAMGKPNLRTLDDLDEIVDHLHKLASYGDDPVDIKRLDGGRKHNGGADAKTLNQAGKRKKPRQSKAGRRPIPTEDGENRRNFVVEWMEAKQQGGRLFKEVCGDWKISENTGRAWRQWVKKNPKL